MTGAMRLRLDDEQASVAQLAPAPHSFSSAPADEIMDGNVVLIGFRGAGTDGRAAVDGSWLPDVQLEIVEAAETLTWDKQVRAYEEVVIRKENLERHETIAATLRHHEAEVVIEGQATTGVLDTRPEAKGSSDALRRD